MGFDKERTANRSKYWRDGNKRTNSHSATAEWYATIEMKENMPKLDENDLAELCDTFLTGFTVGIGSIILLFSNGAQIIMQCMFQYGDAGAIKSGHGEDIYSSPLLFPLLNRRVNNATINSDLVLVLRFDEGKFLNIVPESNGLESYVVTTRYGIFPIVNI